MSFLPTTANELAVRTVGVWYRYHPDDANRPRPKAVLPGAFNPLHKGHRQIAQLGAEILAVPVDFEISMTNVDKQPLDPDEVARRVEQFAVADSVWITRAPTFLEKSRLFPNAFFLTGADTIVRIADARYYDGSEAARNEAIDEITKHDCRFLVFGRRVDGRFSSLSDLDLPSALTRLCTEVPEKRFRVDVSSTQLRTRQG
ncbi:MAG: hypothetical protein H8E44_26895 [Planctomycetes bacterium]|nr:hypothetical protein [Planctomycetota bacterium]MBL7042367.1 hypothetical protein [Pirellulaceae bacterium]